jgi:hypothetical protein
MKPEPTLRTDPTGSVCLIKLEDPDIAGRSAGRLHLVPQDRNSCGL